MRGVAPAGGGPLAQFVVAVVFVTFVVIPMPAAEALGSPSHAIANLGPAGSTRSIAYGINEAGFVADQFPDINDAGQIVGYGVREGSIHALLITSALPLEISNVAELADPVGRFERFEANIELSHTYVDPFDPGVIKVDVTFTAPSGATSSIPAFWFQDFDVRAGTETNEVYDPVGDPSWRVRFAPAEVGTYSYVVHAVDGTGGSADSTSMTFDVTATGDQGFVRVDGTDGRFFRFDRGAPYVPFGHNAGWDASNPPLSGTHYYEALFDESFAPQENWTRIWMTDFNRSALEWGPGHWSGFYDGVGAYSLPAAWRMDQILGSAEAHGLYVQLVLNDHGQFSTNVNARWHESCDDPSDGCTPGEPGYVAGNPYSDAAGGPVPDDRPDLFFSDPEARELFERRLRYVAARWGGYTNVLAWELFNEIQFTGSPAHNPYNDPAMWADILDWHGEMAAYLATVDPFDHLVTTSSDPAAAGADAGSVPGIDIVQLHDYTAGPRDVTIAGYVAGLQDAHGKPVIAGEFGLSTGDEAGFDPVAYGGSVADREHLSQGTHVHNAVWAGALLGSGSMSWSWDIYMAAEPSRNRVPPDFPLAPRVFPAVAAYVEGEDWATLGLERSSLATSAGLFSVGMDNGTRAYLWVRDGLNTFGSGEPPGDLAGRTISDATVEIPGMADGDYRVRVFDTYGAGGRIDSFMVTASGGPLHIDLPDFTRDLALKVRPARTTTRLVSVTGTGDQGDYGGSVPGVSDDGRYVAYTSASTNLVPNGGDTNNSEDVFVYDRITRSVSRVSVKADGSQGYPAFPQSGVDGRPAFSADGRYVVFASLLQLVPGDTNDQHDVYVRDRDTDEDGIFDESGTGTTVLMAVAGDGTPGVPYYSLYPDISADGRFVSFQSADNNLVAGDGNGRDDVFVHDRDSDEDGVFDELGSISTTRISVRTDGSEGSDGSGLGRMSADGRYLSFLTVNPLVPGDGNGKVDAYVRDRDVDEDGIFDEAGDVETFRASFEPGGSELTNHLSAADISANGHWVAFQVPNVPTGVQSQLLYAFDVQTRTSFFVRNLGSVNTVLSVSISADGETIATNDATSAVAVDRSTGTMQPASVYGNGSPAPGRGVEISADGRFVAFYSDTGLVPGDQYNGSDVYLTDLSAPPQTVPGSPTDVQAVAGDGSATLTWWAPDDGGSPIQYYMVTVSPPDAGPFLLNLSRLRTTINELTPGTTYTFSVSATNSIGTGASTSSNAVVPTAIPTFQLDVTKSGDGGGTVTGGGGEINCGTTCSASFPVGTPVDLTATPDATSEFSGWSGEGCLGTGTCQVTMDQARSVTATFSLVSGDTTPPTIDLVTPRDLAWYAAGDFVEVEFTCQDEAGGSGLDTCVGDLPNGTEIDTFTAGTYTFEVTATDVAGNTTVVTHTYTVTEPLFDADTDGDGLLDEWETSGIDVDGDGTVDLHLESAPFNADPNHKDIFVEVDFMDCTIGGCAGGDTSHEPQPGALNDVVQAFADAPVFNPDGLDGITLHAMEGEAIAEPTTPVAFINRGPGASDDFDDLKTGTQAPCDGSFGTAAERAEPECELILAARALAFHYVIFGHAYSEAPASSGIGEIFGNDFMVTLGGKSPEWIAAAGSLRNAESGTFMHELGHNLNLLHGGLDSINCKPNYLSVMNYAFQVPAIDPTRPLDYSRGETNAFLDETFLEEEFGISGPFGRNAIYGVNGKARVAPADGPIDWDDDGDPFGIVSADINWIDSFGSGCSGFGEDLASDSDWENLSYEFMFFGQVADGVHDSAQELVGQELTAEEAEQTAASVDFDGDGVPNSEDTCPADPQDMDGDGVGDACDQDNVASIDIKPGSVDNPIKKGSSGTTPVAILSTATFSAPARVVQASLTFGHMGTEASFKKCDVPRDVNGDGRLDLLCHFTTTKTGFQLGDAVGVLLGLTVGGAKFVGMDRVKIVKK